MKLSLGKTVTATLAAGAILALSAAASASVITEHNGTGDFNGTGPVNVLLADGIDLPLDIQTCEEALGPCFTKTWLPGSIDDVHSMVLSEFTEVGEEAILIELVINATDTPWTDYHIELVGGAMLDIALTGFFEFDHGELVDLTTDGIDVVFDPIEGFEGLASAAWLFFDQPLLPFDLDTMTGRQFVFMNLIAPFDPLLTPPVDLTASVTVSQHPSTGVRVVPEPASLALFGFGLLGLGAMRRRRKTA